MCSQGFSSTPVRLNLIDLALDRTAASQDPPAAQQLPGKDLAGPAHATADRADSLVKPAVSLLKVTQSKLPAISQENGTASEGLQRPNGLAKPQVSEPEMGKKACKKPSKRLKPSIHVSAKADGPSVHESSSQIKQSAVDSDLAFSTNSQPEVEPSAAAAPEAPAHPTAASDLPPSGLPKGKAAKARQKARVGPQAEPARKKQKVAPVGDAAASGASSQNLPEDAQPVGSNASSCPQQPDPKASKATKGKAAGAGQVSGKVSKPRKIMSLHAASQDKSLDKSPLQSDHLAGLRLGADGGAELPAHPVNDLGTSQISGRDPILPISHAQASEKAQAAATDPPELKREVELTSAAAPNGAASGEQDAQPAAPKQSRKAPVAASSKASVLSKRYGSTFIWAQLSGWFKQTVYDPTASLSAERRGTISLPDLESCYSTARQRYTAKVRAFCPCTVHCLCS